MSTSIRPEPTIVPLSSFDAEKDTLTLYQAMKGLGTKEQKVIEVVCARTPDQLKQVESTYQQRYGKKLRAELKSELSGNFAKLVDLMFLGDTELAVEVVKDAGKGIGLNADAIIDFICTRTCEELEEMKTFFKARFNKSLEKEVYDMTSGFFRNLVVGLLSTEREVSEMVGQPEPVNIDDGHGRNIVCVKTIVKVDTHLAIKEAEELHRVCLKEKVAKGYHEENWVRFFCQRSWAQLAETFSIHEKVHDKTIQKVIEEQFSGDFKKALLALVTIACEKREMYFAEALYECMKGVGTNDQRLVRIVANRGHLDLGTIKMRFLQHYDKPLDVYVTDDTSGDYRKALLAVIHGNKSPPS